MKISEVLSTTCRRQREYREVSHLTKAEIVRRLRQGAVIARIDAGAKKASKGLTTPAQRRIFEYLLTSPVREPTGLPEGFIAGLHAAFDAETDPAKDAIAPIATSAQPTSWRLHSIESEGFGGLNVWKGGPFRFEFEADSYLIEGPNGS